MKSFFTFTILIAQFACNHAQFIINGDITIFSKMKKSNVMEDEAKAKAEADALAAAAAAEQETEELLQAEEVAAYTERGSATLPGGAIILANINIGEQGIDPRTPKNLGNPLARQLQATTASLSIAMEEEAKDFWHTTIPVMMGGNMYTLPTGEEKFTARLRRWYQALFNLNMGEIIDDFGSNHYQPYCNQTSMASFEQLYEPQCVSPCQCTWYSDTAWKTRCEASCAGNDLISIYECRWATAAKDSIVPLAKSNNYCKHQTSCGLQIDLAYSKALQVVESKTATSTNDHPMDPDVGINMGTF